MITGLIKEMNLIYAPIVKNDLEMILYRVEMIEIWAKHPEQIEEINKLKNDLAKQLEYVSSKISEEQAS